jgi:hypothetical protein
MFRQPHPGVPVASLAVEDAVRAEIGRYRLKGVVGLVRVGWFAGLLRIKSELVMYLPARKGTSDVFARF